MEMDIFSNFRGNIIRSNKSGNIVSIHYGIINRNNKLIVDTTNVFVDRLADYQNYYLLDVNDIVVLLELVLLFNPKFFIEKGIFILDESLLPYDLDNQFYKITDERIGMHINNQIIVGGRTVNVLKVMVCNEDWLFRNYINPLKRAFNREAEYERRYPSPPPPPPKPQIIYVPQPVYITRPNVQEPQIKIIQRSKKEKGCCCCQ